MALPRKKVTIKQVAQEAGVSTQTVSRVINNRPDVAPETRRQILNIIERLGYRPSALARSLIQQRSTTLGVVIAGLRFIGPSRALNGITTRAEEMGYSLLLKKLPHFDTADTEPILNDLLTRQVDGIIWAVSEIGSNHDWLHNHLPDLPVPIIFLTTRQKSAIATVSIDNYRGGRMATEHLLAQGCQQVGHLAGPLSWWEAQQRFEGWRDALCESGRMVAPPHWIEGDWSSQSAVEPVEQLLAQYPAMDGIFVANDQMALTVLQMAHQRGLRVPQDLAVIGFDGLAESPFFWPPLSTIRQNLHQLGCIAVQELVKMIDAGRNPDEAFQPEAVLLKPELLERASSLKK